MQRTVHCLLVAPPGVGRRGVELFLTACGVRVTATADDEHDAATALRRMAIDIVLADLSLGDRTEALVARVAEQAPRVGVLGYGDRRPWPLQELLDFGLRGFVLTTSEAGSFLEAIRAVAAGAKYLDPDFTIAGRGDHCRAARQALSGRERQVLGLLAHGFTGREIATELFLSPATVRTHVQNAMHKLGARTRAQAIMLAAGEAA